MTQKDLERLATAEQAIRDMRGDIDAIRTDTAELKKTLNMGRGAFWAVGTLMATVVAGVAWLWDKIKHP